MGRAERRAGGQRGPRETPTVEINYLHPGDVSNAFAMSLLRCRDYELMRTQRLIGVRERRARSASIAKARNEITTMFMRGAAEVLWFIDADMGFPRDAALKMLSVLTPERPIIGGLCFAHRTEGFDDETNADLFGMIPTLSVWDKNEAGEIIAFRTVEEYPRDAVCQVDSTGAAFVMIHRDVLAKLQVDYGDNWWTQLPAPHRNEPFGEDTSFFIRAHESGFPLHVHTGVRTSHDKGGIFLTEQAWDEQEARKRAAVS